MMGIKRLPRKEKTPYKHSDMWEETDHTTFLNYCPDTRDRCYHAIANDSSARPHEILNLKIKDIKFTLTEDGIQFAELFIREGKISRLGLEERWTHWWDKENSVAQLDYILLSPHLSKNSDTKPYIESRGLSNRIKKFTHLGSKMGEKIPFDFERFPQVSKDIEASDHCPIFFNLNVS